MIISSIFDGISRFVKANEVVELVSALVFRALAVTKRRRVLPMPIHS